MYGLEFVYILRYARGPLENEGKATETKGTYKLRYLRGIQSSLASRVIDDNNDYGMTDILVLWLLAFLHPL